jgi:metal-dependent amidase/aminoacylase/carboxypeptidase family protein
LKTPKLFILAFWLLSAQEEVGKINYRPKGAMAASDWFRIIIKENKRTERALWQGVDPIVTASQIIWVYKQLLSRNVDQRNPAAVVSVGKITAGVRSNIIPEEFEMNETIRTLDSKVQEMIHDKVNQIVTNIAESAGATAE